MKQTVILFAAFLLFLSSCKKEDDPVVKHAETKKVTDFYAPADVRDHTTGEITQLNPYVYFSFEKGAAVDSTDSWDIAFKGTYIITNSGISGTGNAKSTVLLSTFDDVTEAPADADLKEDTALGNAITKENCWNYNPVTHLISSVAGRVIVVKTNTGKYAKLELLNFYKGAPSVPNPLEDKGGYITFNYVYQVDGRTF